MGLTRGIWHANDSARSGSARRANEYESSEHGGRRPTPRRFRDCAPSRGGDYKTKAYAALKEAITNMDIYRSSGPVMLDERELSERLGVSRTPIREALAMLQQEGFIRVAPRRGIMVVRRTKRQIIEMIQAWAALESMAARLITLHASDDDIATLRSLFQSFGEKHELLDHLDEYSSANIAFHQALIRLSGSETLASMTENLTLHLRAIRHRTIFEMNRAQRSLRGSHADHRRPGGPGHGTRRAPGARPYADACRARRKTR